MGQLRTANKRHTRAIARAVALRDATAPVAIDPALDTTTR